MKNHRSAICARDMDASLRFWRDGLGFAVQMYQRLEGDWPTLFGTRQPALHSIFLGDPGDTTGGIVDLVKFEGTDEGPPLSGAPLPAFFLLSVYLDVDVALHQLAALGRRGEPRRITVPPGCGWPSSRTRTACGWSWSTRGQAGDAGLCDVTALVTKRSEPGPGSPPK